jgi:hypothetical protein
VSLKQVAQELVVNLHEVRFVYNRIDIARATARRAARQCERQGEPDAASGA